MTMLRAVASAVVLVGGIVLLLALLGLAGGTVDTAPLGLIGLALLAAGLVLMSPARGRRSRYRYTATNEPFGPGGGHHGGSGVGGPAEGGWSGDSGSSGSGDSGGGRSRDSGSSWWGDSGGGFFGGGDSGGGSSGGGFFGGGDSGGGSSGGGFFGGGGDSGGGSSGGGGGGD